jgi:hypothetical protein
MADLGHGERLSAKEYERRIVALYAGLPPDPGKQVRRQLSRQELDLAIDHRLGCNFPAARRDALWEIQCRMEKRRWRLLLGWVWRSLSGRRQRLHERADRLAGQLVDAYAKVLSPDELSAYFDLRDGERPTLPMDDEDR